jgi:BirA family transcriptional regulator, biotin operon repressor / biotin---[acetyl-CoA-carboxylase] ligase
MPLDLDLIRTAFPGRRIVWLESVGSTMTEAARLAAEDCASGTVVMAEEQMAGQGRYGRPWYSERESGLYLSVVLRLPLTPGNTPALTLALGLAAAEAIREASGLQCDLRWPNDVLIGGKKCAGILVQFEADAFVAGIGLNVNQSRFPAQLTHTATSLLLEGGKPQMRELLLVHLLEAVDSFTQTLIKDGREAILRMFTQASSYAKGKRVIVDQGGANLLGVTDGLDPSGFLYVRQDNGTRTLVLAGGVRPA